MSKKSNISILPKVKRFPKPPKMKRPRCKNICICGRKMEKQHDDCLFCGGGEFYVCPSLICGKMYDLNGVEM